MGGLGEKMKFVWNPTYNCSNVVKIYPPLLSEVEKAQNSREQAGAELGNKVFSSAVCLWFVLSRAIITI